MSNTHIDHLRHIVKNIFPLIENVTSAEPGPDADPEFLELLEDLREMWSSHSTQEIIEIYEDI